MKTEISEGNKLIAEFMGGKIISIEPYEMPHGSHSEGVIEKWKLPKNIPFNEGCKIGFFKYDSSWDHLMTVIDKIEEMGFDVSMQRDTENYICYCSIFGQHEDPPYININTESKKEATWLAVVDFIKWYNKNNNK